MISEENSLDAAKSREPRIRPDETGEMKMQDCRTILPQNPPHTRHRAELRAPGVLDHLNMYVGKLQIGAHFLGGFFKEAQNAFPPELAELNRQFSRVRFGAPDTNRLDTKDGYYCVLSMH